MAYRKLGRDNKHRKSMLANLTRDVIMNERIQTTETRAKEVRKFVDKMITYGKRGDLVANIKVVVPKQLSDEEKLIYEKLRDVSTFNPRNN